MAEKCVHQGCGKVYTDAEEPCVYHPGPPIFHEGQKGTHFPLTMQHRTADFILPLFYTSSFQWRLPSLPFLSRELG